MKDKTISQIIEEVASEICDHYCKYMHGNYLEEELDEVLNKYCSNCPLNKLQ